MTKKLKINVTGASHIGKFHTIKSMPNQDAYCAEKIVKGDKFGYLIAVADGHGNAMHKYSDVGSDFAIKVTRKLCERQLESSFPDRKVLSKFTTSILFQWMQSVHHYHLNHHSNETFRPEFYGTTLRFVFCDENGQGLLCAIGDGITAIFNPECDKPIFYVNTHNEELDLPTLSLCNATVENIRLTTIDLANKPAVMIATDGLDTSFDTSANFQNHYRKFVKSASNSELDNNVRTLTGAYSASNNKDDSTLVVMTLKNEACNNETNSVD